MSHHFSTLLVVWGAFVACLMLGSLVWNLTHRKKIGATLRTARGASVAAPISRPVVRRAVVRPAAYRAPVAVAPIVTPVAVVPVVAPVARQNGATLRQQMIAAGRLIPADAQTPSLPAPDLDFASVSALDFAL